MRQRLTLYHWKWEDHNRREGNLLAMVGNNTRRNLHLLVGAVLTIGTTLIGSRLTAAKSLPDILGWFVLGVVATYFYLRWQLRSQEESPEAIKERVSQLTTALREQVRSRSYGTRRRLIEAPLRELDLDITPRMGWVRDPRLLEPESPCEEIADDIVAAFESSRRRMLIVGEPGSGKTMAAYSLIEYLDQSEGYERIPLLVNLSAWEAQANFEAFLVDYLCSSVGYEAPERAVAEAFIGSDQYALILDGLDEIPTELRTQFSERLDEFVSGLPDEVGVVVTCRTQEYEQLLADHATGLGLVQAVEMLPLTSEQLDSAFVELAKGDNEWELFLSQRHLTAYQRVRHLLSNPLFLNLAVVGHLSPTQLLDWSTTEQELQDLVVDRYLDHTLADERQYEVEDARRYLSWIAHFLNGDEVSPFGLKTSDYTVFDLADLTPPDPPRRYRLFGGLIFGLILGLVMGLATWGVSILVWGLIMGLVLGLAFGLIFVLVSGLIGWPFKRSALSSRLILVWPSTRRRLLAFLRRAVRGLALGMVLALAFGLLLGLLLELVFVLNCGLLGNERCLQVNGELVVGPVQGLAWALVFALITGLALGPGFGLGLGLGSGLLETQSVLITSRTPKEARTRSLVAALTWLASGLTISIVGLGWGWVAIMVTKDLAERMGMEVSWVPPLAFGLCIGLILALRNGGWFVVLQKVAHRRLARAGNLPSPPYDFLEWGIERQIFRRVGGGIRFRHNLIQQHLATASVGGA